MGSFVFGEFREVGGRVREYDADCDGGRAVGGNESWCDECGCSVVFDVYDEEPACRRCGVDL